MPTFIWRDYAPTYEDEGFIVVNARNEEEAREKFWTEYKRAFEEWFAWLVVEMDKNRRSHVAYMKKKGEKPNPALYRTNRDESWQNWKKMAGYAMDNPPSKILFDDEVYYYGDFNEGGTGIKRFKDETGTQG